MEVCPGLDRLVLGNPKREKADFIVFNQHDGGKQVQANLMERVVKSGHATGPSLEELFAMYPQLSTTFMGHSSIARDFFELERDLGASYIIKQIIDKVIEIMGDNVRIDSYKVTIPRGLVDSNRVPARDFHPTHNPSGVPMDPIRGILDHKRYPELVKELESVHLRIYRALMAALNDLAEHGVFLDFHTMNTHDIKRGTPYTKSGPSLEEVAHYIDVRLKEKYRGAPRLMNFLTSYPNDQRVISNLTLMRFMKEQFDASRIPHNDDHPYEYLDFASSGHFVEKLILPDGRSRGLVFDASLGLISVPGFEHNINPLLDFDRIDELTTAIAISIVRTLDEQR